MMKKTMSQYLEMNPLEDPIVRDTLQRIRMTGKELINITVKELNKKLISCSDETISRLKKCRRTLKNRGYAKNCRIKRLSLRDELQRSNAELRAAYNNLELRCRLLQKQLTYYQNRCGQSIKREPFEVCRPVRGFAVGIDQESGQQQINCHPAHSVQDQCQQQNHYLQYPATEGHNHCRAPNQQPQEGQLTSYGETWDSNHDSNQMIYRNTSSSTSQISPSSSSSPMCRCIDCSDTDSGFGFLPDESREYAGAPYYSMQASSNDQFTH